jgi:uncharacterized protein YyaL (SSP411 family)
VSAKTLWTVYDLVPGQDGRGLFRRTRTDEEAARLAGIGLPALKTGVAEALGRLRTARASRAAPPRDDKIVASWNGLALSAFAQGGLVLGDEHFIQRARRLAECVLRDLRGVDGRLRRTFREGRGGAPGFLDDHAFLIQGFLDLAEASADLRWLDEALRLQSELDRDFLDPESGGYYGTGPRHEALLAREKPTLDWAEPSGNSVALMNLLRLAELTGRESFRDQAHRGFAAFGAGLERSPSSSPRMLGALDFARDRPRQVLILAPAGGDAGPLLDVVRTTYLPNRVLVSATEGQDLEGKARKVPALEGKSALRGRPTAFVCEQGRCEAPAWDPAVLRQQLAKTVPWARAPAR